MNRERLKAVIEEIEADFARYDQTRWSNLDEHWETRDDDGVYIPAKVKEYEGQIINCGTVGCLAGLASLRYAPVDTKFWGDMLVTPELEEGGYFTYHQFGSDVLDLTSHEADYLFHADRTWEKILAFADMSDEARESFMDSIYGDND